MQHQFDVVIERDADGYYVAKCAELPGCHTQGHSLDEVMERIREAILLCLEVQDTEPHNLEFVGIQRATVAASTEDLACCRQPETVAGKSHL